jgi:NADP-dependent 3-hydroxy acid dehydrogenase YdfG
MNKIVFITGATAGIGLAIAKKFAENNFNLIICGRRAERLSKIKKELEGNNQIEVKSLELDVRDNLRVKEAINSLDGKWRQIDILINNAGLASGLSKIHEGDIEDWEKMIDTNIKGLLYISRAIMPIMVERKAGHIINIGSIAGKETYLNGNVYCATKHAVDSITKAMRIDLVEYGIKVSQIAPGAVNTEFSTVRFHGDKAKADSTYQGYQPLLAEDIADAVYYTASLPKHVNINDLVIMPTAQASPFVLHKE